MKRRSMFRGIISAFLAKFGLSQTPQKGVASMICPTERIEPIKCPLPETPCFISTDGVWTEIGKPSPEPGSRLVKLGSKDFKYDWEFAMDTTPFQGFPDDWGQKGNMPLWAAQLEQNSITPEERKNRTESVLPELARDMKAPPLT